MDFAEVILPLPLENHFTYRIPEGMAIERGCRVIVPFGTRRFYTAIVDELHDRQPEPGIEIKAISSLLDEKPILRPGQLEFWRWIANYYICKLGDVYKAALPAGLKLESETVVTYLEDFEADAPLKASEQRVLDAFRGDLKLTVGELEKRTGSRNLLPIVSALTRIGAVQIDETLKQGFKPKKQAYIRLAEYYTDDKALVDAFAQLGKAKKQEALLTRFLELVGDTVSDRLAGIPKKKLQENDPDHSSSALNALLKRGILEQYEKEIGRLGMSMGPNTSLSPLSEEQTQALQKIHDCFSEKEVCLLHGVTSSGKTEIYAHLIEEVLNKGKQVLYLLPEIALTTQITERLAGLFGDRLIVYHSKFSDNERVEIWNRLLTDDGPLLILGVRSSLFLPFAHLGLIIVDEEHEPSFKQQDPAPRYHARDTAIVLAASHGAKTLLGSATPSIESYFNARTGKYGLVELKGRYGNARMPEIRIVDMKDLRRKRIIKDSNFSPLLVESIHEALETNGQVILFQNRRGFSPFVECPECGWVPRCMNCDVSLTYHKYHNELVCHYCGHKILAPKKCPECGHEGLRTVGAGTEKIEEEIQTLFPKARVARLDLDSVRTRNAYEQLFENFESGKIQILIGTQMVSKGLDFSRVRVVGILSADTLMNFPDFRAHERAFQLMTQVAGRAGRRGEQGLVVLQTNQAEHPLIRLAHDFNYPAMVESQLTERRLFHYPPYYRLITLVLRSRDEAVLLELATLYANKLRERLGHRVLGPVSPPVARVQTFYIRQVVIKVETTVAITPMRAFLEKTREAMRQHPLFKKLLIHYDVDPV